MADSYVAATNAADSIRRKLPIELSNPRVAVVCGTGLGGISNILHPEPRVEIPYKDVGGFKVSTVPGHAGKLIFGFIGTRKVPVVCMVGRLHSYEGYDIKDTVFPIRVFTILGTKILIATNAAGGVNQTYSVGDIMLIDDHLNLPGLSGLHPLKGSNDDRFGPRFLALSDAYDVQLRKLVFQKANLLNITRPIHEGTYVYVSGPTFETRAEVRFISHCGGDAVGMSTVPEVIVGRHGGLRVLALSLITNVAVIDKPSSGREKIGKSLDIGKASHEEVLSVGKDSSADVEGILAAVIGEL